MEDMHMNNVTAILNGADQASLDAFMAFHLAEGGPSNTTMFDALLDIDAILMKI